MAKRYKTTQSPPVKPPVQPIYSAVKILSERRARSIAHVIETINSLLGPMNLEEWTLESATAAGSTPHQLGKRLLVREGTWPSTN